MISHPTTFRSYDPRVLSEPLAPVTDQSKIVVQAKDNCLKKTRASKPRKIILSPIAASTLSLEDRIKKQVRGSIGLSHEPLEASISFSQEESTHPCGYTHHLSLKTQPCDQTAFQEQRGVSEFSSVLALPKAYSGSKNRRTQEIEQATVVASATRSDFTSGFSCDSVGSEDLSGIESATSECAYVKEEKTEISTRPHSLPEEEALKATLDPSTPLKVTSLFALPEVCGNRTDIESDQKHKKMSQLTREESNLERLQAVFEGRLAVLRQVELSMPSEDHSPMVLVPNLPAVTQENAGGEAATESFLGNLGLKKSTGASGEDIVLEPAGSVPVKPLVMNRYVRFDLTEGPQDLLSLVSTTQINPIRDVQIKGSDTALTRIKNISRELFANALVPVKFLGEGAYGAVYHVRKTGEAVQADGSIISRIENMAMKIFFRTDCNAQQSLMKEAKLLLRFNHGSIVKVYQHSVDYGYFLMPLLSKMNLAEAALSGLLTEEKRKFVVVQLAFILEYLKLKSVAHFDFKPHNIAVNVNNKHCVVTLLDFGIAEDAPDFRKFHIPRGPIYYRAPEMYLYGVLGEGSYDPFIAHWFALGVSLYQVAYLSNPYQSYCLTEEENLERRKWVKALSDDDARQYFASSHHGIKAPATAQINPDLEDLIKKLTDPNPATRAGFETVRHHPWLSDVNWSIFERSFAEVTLRKQR